MLIDRNFIQHSAFSNIIFTICGFRLQAEDQFVSSMGRNKHRRTKGSHRDRRPGPALKIEAGVFEARQSDAPYQIWGANLEADAVRQLRNACKLPVAVSAALMPDAHVGYGLPIGGVLATDEAVIPYAVGVDIACRMKMTVLDLPVTALADDAARLTNALERET